MQFVAWAVSALTWTYRRIELAMFLCPFWQHLRPPLLQPALAAMACPAHRCHVGALSDDHGGGTPGVLWASPDDIVLSGGEDALTREERTVAAQSVLAFLRCPCNCTVHKRRGGRDHRLVACCLHACWVPGLLQQVIDQQVPCQHVRKLDRTGYFLTSCGCCSTAKGLQ